MESIQPQIIDKPSPKYLLQNLYQIPTCSICLQDLKGRLVSLQCGHVFHLQCIENNLIYSRTCPNCKEEIFNGQIRLLHFNNEFIQTTKIYEQVIASLSSPASSQIQKIIEDSNQKTRQKEETKNYLIRCQRQKKIIKKVLKNVRNNHRLQDNIQIQQMIHCVRAMNQQLSNYKQEIKDKIMEIAQLKNELKNQEDENKTQRQQIEHQWTTNQILRSHNKQLLQKETLIDNKTAIYDNQLHRKKQQIELLRQQIQQIHNNTAFQRKKYLIFKNKYNILSQIAKQKGVSEREIPDIREPLETIQSFAEQTSHKPLLKANASLTIGGFGCKNKLKALMKSK